MFYRKIRTLVCSFLMLVIFIEPAIGQKPTNFFEDAIKEKREAFYKMVTNTIDKTLLLPLNAASEEKWISAFYNIALVNYKTATLDSRIDYVAKIINQQSDDCKKGFLNLVNTLYPKKYYKGVESIFATTIDPKLMAMCVNYLLPNYSGDKSKWLSEKLKKEMKKDTSNPILHELLEQIKSQYQRPFIPSLKPFFVKSYLPNTTIVFSFQRKDRNYPGLVLIRKADGSFYKNESGAYFSTGQLARSLSNMPGYITNGNTPKGFFKMNGFDTSNNYFIGTTTNIQLSMPHEYHRKEIDGNIVDTTWTMEQYKNLLPISFQNYEPLYESFYAGKAGRTEIIAHGTTVDPNFYKGNTYYPYTPTMGCLTCIETWSSKTGLLQTSNQLLLTQALQKAGGANGYLLVIEIDDKKAPITFSDIKKYLP